MWKPSSIALWCAWQESLKPGWSNPFWQHQTWTARVQIICAKLQWQWKGACTKVMGVAPVFLKVTIIFKDLWPNSISRLYMALPHFFKSVLVYSRNLLITCVFALTFKNWIWGNYHLIVKFQAAIGKICRLKDINNNSTVFSLEFTH